MKITQKKLVEEVSRRSGLNISVINHVYDTTEEAIIDYLATTAKKEDISIKLFNGITVDRKYVPERHFITGALKGQRSEEHYFINANISRYYREKMNEQFFGSPNRK